MINNESLTPLSFEQIQRQIDTLISTLPESATVDMKATMAQLQPGERAQRLYEYLGVFREWSKKSRQVEAAVETKPESFSFKNWLKNVLRKSPEKKIKQPIDSFNPGLAARIKALWQDPETRKVFFEKYRQSSQDFVAFKNSSFATESLKLHRKIEATDKQYRSLTKLLFLEDMPAQDRLELEAEIEDAVFALRGQQNHHQENLAYASANRSPESCDALAMLRYEKIRTMRQQMDKTGFVWFESLTETYHEALIALLNGRWPLFIGEAGTGKSVLAVALAEVLTGEKPTLVACTPRTNEHQLIARMAMQGDKTFEEYGAAMTAATGFNSSLPEAEQIRKHGIIVRLDELFKLGENSPVFAFLKELAGLKPGDIYRQRQILRGFKIIATTNPAGARYSNDMPNPALLREFAPIEVDYPKMTADNPELYDFILACLMNKDGQLVGAAEDELAPGFEKKNDQTELIEDSTNTKHGYVYRLAFAIRAVQDAFIYGSTGEPTEKALRVKANKKVTQEKTGEVIRLETTTITPGDVKNWMQNFSSRRQLNHSIGESESLEEYLKAQLNLFIEQSRPEDRESLLAIFNYFQLFHENPNNLRKKSISPLTPKQIGYLSPVIPRPIVPKEAMGVSQEPLVPMHQDTRVVLVTAETVDVQAISAKLRLPESRWDALGNEIELQVEEVVLVNNEQLTYVGVSANGQLIFRRADVDLYLSFASTEIAEQAQFPDLEMRALIGDNYFGMRELTVFAEELGRVDLGDRGRVRFKFDGINFAQQLADVKEFARTHEMNEHHVILRPAGIIFYDETEGEQYSGQITLEAIYKLLESRNPGNPQMSGQFDLTFEDDPAGELDWQSEGFRFTPLSAGWAVIRNEIAGSITINAKTNPLQKLSGGEPNGSIRAVTDTVFDGILSSFAPLGLSQFTTSLSTNEPPKSFVCVRFTPMDTIILETGYGKKVTCQLEQVRAK